MSIHGDDPLVGHSTTGSTDLRDDSNSSSETSGGTLSAMYSGATAQRPLLAK